MPQPNMKKEYRAELKSLRKHRGDALRTWKAFAKEMRKTLRAMSQSVNRIESRTKTNLARFDKRVAILEGRLS